MKKSSREILDELIIEHEEERCDCDLTDYGRGHCIAGAYLNSEMSLEDTLEEIEGDYIDD